MNRRNFLAKTGVGTGMVAAGGAGLGVVAATNASTAEDPRVVTTVEATGTHAFMTARSGTPDGENRTDLLDMKNVPFTAEGSLEISGEVYDDGTWQMTEVSFPSYVSDGSDDFSIEFTATEFSTPGTFDPESGLVTAAMTLNLQGGGLGFPGPFDLTLTSGTSGDMTGGLSRPSESGLTLTLVDNEFGEVDHTLEMCTPGVGSCPYLGPPGRNWFELGLEMTVDDPSALAGVPVEPQAVVGSNSPQDLDGDGRFEDVRGDGEVDASDVQALFDNLDSPAVQDNAANYNFSGGSSEEVTVFDVQSLFDQVSNAR